MAEKKLTQKKLKIQHTVDSVTRIEGFLANYEEVQHHEVKPRLERLEDLFATFESLASEYESLDDSVVQESLLVRAKVEEQYLRIKGGLVAKLQNGTIVPAQMPQVMNNQHLKLPTIELPKFDGNLNEWITFHDSFSAIIHTSLDISPVQKLQYLRSALRGDALKCIEALPISSANYPIAWDALVNRYQNKGLLKKIHLQGLTAPSKARGQSFALRNVVEDFHRHVKILGQLGEPVHGWSTLLVHLLTNKLDPRTLRDWEEHVKGEPNYEELVEFLQKKIRTIEAMEIAAPKPAIINKQPYAGSKLMAHAATEKRVSNCVLCNEPHALTKCSAFENMNIRDRWSLVQSKRLCCNCLNKDHFARNCQSKYSCRTCNKRHHTWLHSGFESQTGGSKGANHSNQVPPADINLQEGPPGPMSHVEASAPSRTVVTNATTRSASVFLSTALLIIVDRFGKEHLARALLDSASQANLISERLSQILRLNGKNVDVCISGVNNADTRIRKAVCTHIRSRASGMSMPIEFFVVNKVTNQLPTSTVNTVNWNLPANVELADPQFNIIGNIDLLIGAEHYYELIKNGRIQLAPNLPLLVESEFGWLVSGRAEISIKPTSIVCHAYTAQNSIEDQLERFWTIEELPANSLSISEKRCEQIYKETTYRTEEGRYVVTLPKHPEFKERIGESKTGAMRRFQQLERKFSNRPDIKKSYDEFIHEYLTLNHMELDCNEKDEIECYLPHHAVFKESSATTKVRVVFDGSAKTSTGSSLNDLLLVGPVVQQDLLAIAIRFRKHRIALVADAEKMYRQVLTTRMDSSLQKIVYRFDKDQPIQTYRLKTVTYGLAPSSYLATRTLVQLAEDEGAKYPLAKRALENDFYVDDLISGEDSTERATQLRNELNEILLKGGFTLHKWCSNSLKVLEGLSPERVATQSTVTFHDGESIKTLGICWEPASDAFKFDININESNAALTKRQILSQIAQLFDPLGLIAPVIIHAKMLMQQIWLLALDWDDPVPDMIASKWKLFVLQLPDLKYIRIERYAFLPNSVVEMHCFVDASTLGYGTSIYCRSETSDGTIKVQLIAAKSRVAPLKQLSLPRLELCAALLGARLYEKIAPALDMKFQNVTFWSDSSVVLHWLKAPPYKWKTYVANRVSEIQSTTHIGKWYHIDGLENPADLVSRGLLPEEIIQNQKWFHGPEWLMKPKECWPYAHQPQGLPPGIDLESKPTTLAVQVNLEKEVNPIFLKFSSYRKLIHVTAYCLRFMHNSKTTKDRRIFTIITPDEQVNATKVLVRLVQAEVFPKEIKQLKQGHSVIKHTNLKLLNPFLDKDGIIRVGGRLNLSTEVYSVKHPMILPGFHPFTQLLIASRHRKLLHGGLSLTLSNIRDEFWPINGRRAVRSVIRKCYNCIRANPRPMQQPMGQLPTSRTLPGRPFSNTGVDYCGPVFIKSAIRKSTAIKAYIAIFVCFSTKAVHIELVSDLSSAAFMSALRRFIARRGKPEHIYSDNGTNFIGAKNELHALYTMLRSKKEEQNIAQRLSNDGIKWHLIPPRAPNFGGLWEAAVKVAKTHMLRQIGNAALLPEDLTTLLAQIEACMNSRPLLPLNEDGNDLEALTPGHFLIGSSLQALPDPDLRNIPINRLNRFQFIQQRAQYFWDRWSKEYLREQNRQASRNSCPVQLKVGQLVILQDQLLPPCQWPLARIVELHPGSDGIQRVATIRTATGTFKRPITKLCLLPSSEENNNEGDVIK